MAGCGGGVGAGWCHRSRCSARRGGRRHVVNLAGSGISGRSSRSSVCCRSESRRWPIATPTFHWSASLSRLVWVNPRCSPRLLDPSRVRACVRLHPGRLARADANTDHILVEHPHSVRARPRREPQRLRYRTTTSRSPFTPPEGRTRLSRTYARAVELAARLQRRPEQPSVLFWLRRDELLRRFNTTNGPFRSNPTT